MGIRRVVLKNGAREHRLSIDDNRTVDVDGERLNVGVEQHGAFRVGTAPARTAWAIASDNTCWVFFDGQVYMLEVQREGARRRAAGGRHGALTAPMPGTVLRIQTTVGGTVKRGDTLVILEAMKMELPVRAPADGVVTAVHCHEGELVQPGTALIEIGNGEL